MGLPPKQGCSAKERVPGGISEQAGGLEAVATALWRGHAVMLDHCAAELLCCSAAKLLCYCAAAVLCRGAVVLQCCSAAELQNE